MWCCFVCFWLLCGFGLIVFSGVFWFDFLRGLLAGLLFVVDLYCAGFVGLSFGVSFLLGSLCL